MHVQRPTKRLLAAIPVQYFVFDVLHVDDPSLLGHPYLARRAVLEDLALTGHHVRTPSGFVAAVGRRWRRALNAAWKACWPNGWNRGITRVNAAATG
jgi:ATP-dependent DNA ligase